MSGIHQKKPPPYPTPCPVEKSGQLYWKLSKHKPEIIIYQCQCEPDQWPCSAIVGYLPTEDGDFGDIEDAAKEWATTICTAANVYDVAKKAAQECYSGPEKQFSGISVGTASELYDAIFRGGKVHD